MRIGINLLYLLPGVVGGTETYAAGLLRGLSKIGSAYDFTVFVNREAANWPIPETQNFRRVVCHISGLNRASRYWFEQVRLPKILQEQSVDLVHSLGYVGPIFGETRKVVTIPDLNYVDISDTIAFYRRLPLRFFSILAGARSEAVITISEFSKRRIHKAFDLPTDKIAVTHLAPGTDSHGRPSEGWSELKERYGIVEPYIIAFGGGAVHKNINSLIVAFGTLLEKTPHRLVLIGPLAKNVDKDKSDKDTGLKKRIITTGYVPREHVAPLLSHADLFVLPSLYEGFGLPVLEAQQADIAVVCSTAGSLPEVAGKGAIYFDPMDTVGLSEKIVYCLSRPEVRQKLRQEGKNNLKRFSWEKTAAETLAVYRRVLARGHF